MKQCDICNGNGIIESNPAVGIACVDNVSERLVGNHNGFVNGEPNNNGIVSPQGTAYYITKVWPRIKTLFVCIVVICLYFKNVPILGMKP